MELTQELEQLTRLVALKTGKTPEGVLREAVEERARAAGISVEKPKRSPDEVLRRLREISDRCAALPLLDPRTPDEIIGYDEFGIPK
jgi:antitoxin VapB